MTKFRLLHISDLHLCTEPGRNNFQTLYKDHPSTKIDTVRRLKKHGLLSLIKPASYNVEQLDALAEFVFKRGQAYDAIIASGDLATTGSAKDLKIAFNFIDEKANDLWKNGNRPSLNTHNTPIILLPGNHDNYKSNAPIPISPHFDLQFTNYLKHYHDGVGHRIIIKDDSALCLLFADFSFRRI